MPVAASGADQFAADLPQTVLELPAVEGRVLPHGSGGQDEFVPKGRGDGTTGFQQRHQMGLCGLLEAENRFAPVASVGVTTWQHAGLGNPHAVFILTDQHFGQRNNHSAWSLTWLRTVVKIVVDALPANFSVVRGVYS